MRAARVRAVDPVAALAVEAAAAFLAGPAGASLPLFRDALKLHRKAIGRRKVVPAAGILPLSPAGAVRGERHEPAPGDIDAAGRARRQPDRWSPGLFPACWNWSRGRDDIAKALAKRLAAAPVSSRAMEGPLEAAVVTWALVTIDGAKGGARGRPRTGVRSNDGAVRRGLAARILAQAHARVSQSPDLWREKLDALKPGYARSVLDIIPLRPAWDRVLDRLQAFLASPGAGRCARQKPETGVSVRRRHPGDHRSGADLQARRLECGPAGVAQAAQGARCQSSTI